jgi:signal transduction histidine kinase/CheY-like chemotaxis protein/HPt (histidine-containing phosphotransfer) domain-containing protein
MAQYLATGESPIMDRRIKVTAMRAGGEEFPAELAVTAADINGKKLFTAFMRDISDRVQRETELHAAKQAAEAADKAKTRFLASMSHEIRTPLNALLGFLGLLREQENISTEQLAWIKTAQQSGASLMHLINETLDFSKIEAGKLELEPHEFDIRELVNSTMGVLSPKAKAKGLDLTAGIADNVPQRIREDSARLRQVLINLLDNAIKFTDSGNIELAVMVRGQDDHPVLHFDICDTGRGIPANSHDAVFGEFARLVEAGTLTSGTGLGLSITRRLVEIMGGHIDYQNRDSGGTRFWFEIPLAPAPESAEPPATGSITGGSSPLLKGRILLADDSPANQMVAIAMLQDCGCTVDTVSDGREAVEAVRALPYDLVLMDVSMPEMDGLEATGAIRALAGGRSRIPIVAMTAHAIVGDREKFMAAGMNDYLSKPVTKRRLLETLGKWLPAQQTNLPVTGSNTTAEKSPDQILDTTVFEQLARDTSAEIVPKMLDAFCRETRERISRLKQAHENGSIGMEELQHESHTLKSSAATFGATGLHRIARDVEAACRGGRPSDARNMLGELISSGEQAISAIENHLAGLNHRQANAENP